MKKVNQKGPNTKQPLSFLKLFSKVISCVSSLQLGVKGKGQEANIERRGYGGGGGTCTKFLEARETFVPSLYFGTFLQNFMSFICMFV